MTVTKQLRMLLGFIALALGCANDAVELGSGQPTPTPAEAGERVPEALAREIVPPDWAGYSIGLETPAVFDLGSVGTLEDGPGVEFVASDAEELAVEAQEHASSVVIVKEGRAYRVDFPQSDELDAIYSSSADAELGELAESLDAEPTPQVLEKDDEEARAITDKRDTRVQQGVEMAGALSRSGWLSSIGTITGGDPAQFGESGCTGTLVSPDTVLTAAHCVVTREARSNLPAVLDVAFHPRADGVSGVAGQFPWGHWRGPSSLAQVAISPEYINPTRNCHLKYRVGCRAFDWALIRVERPKEAADHRAYMRYRAFRNDELVGLKSKGYPICDEDSAPVGCQPNTLYGDTASCSADTRLDAADGNHSRAFTHNCDTSRGMSGGPLFRYEGGIPTIAAVHVSDGYATKAVFGDVNMALNLTPSVVRAIDNFR